jgi:hypothetical protein
MFVTGLPSSHVAVSSCQFAGTVSAAAYPEPTSTWVSLDPPFARLNDLFRLEGPPVRLNGNDVLVGSGDGSVTFLIVIVPQLEMLAFAGAMKSFSSAVNDAEDLLFRYAFAKLTH